MTNEKGYVIISKYISIPVIYGIYEVPDETFELLPNGMKIQPSNVVLEMMVMNGQAKKIGTIGAAALTFAQSDEDEDEETGDSPWVEDHE